MVKCNLNKKGVILFMVLAILLIVSFVVTGILNFVLSHYKQTFHRAQRIKAYYAAMAGINLAMEKLRRAYQDPLPWTAGTAGNTYWLCKANATNPPDPPGCLQGSIGPLYNYNITDTNIPYHVAITIIPAGVGGCNATAGVCINATVVNYTSS